LPDEVPPIPKNKFLQRIDPNKESEQTKPAAENGKADTEDKEKDERSNRRHDDYQRVDRDKRKVKGRGAFVSKFEIRKKP
jgi:hypothetical protein